MKNTVFPIEKAEVSTFQIPTQSKESDGTLAWEATTLIICEISAGGFKGMGYTYSHKAAAILIKDKLSQLIKGMNALAVQDCWVAMLAAVRNLGSTGIAASAIAAADTALWDLKARIMEIPLVTLLGQVHNSIKIYGSGGFTSYSKEQLQNQLSGWAEQGISTVKMKVGRHPEQDIRRVREAREAIGDQTELMVDANGGYSRKQALAFAEAFSRYGVIWFEEPVSSDDLSGLRLVRDRAPAGMEIAAGEYGYDLFYFRRMLEAGAVDVLQADTTRCAGYTGFLKTAALCEAANIPFSAHTAPALHLPAACAAIPFRHQEYFFDHVRIEKMLFEGVPEPENGKLSPDLSRPGNGLALKRTDAEKYRI
ncbi:MAG: enolase C-terminal domain-like protein [Calditrichia bacterium]